MPKYQITENFNQLSKVHERYRQTDLGRHTMSSRSRKKEGKKLRDVISHIFAQTTHVALSPPKLSCEVGYRTQ